jgi:hypothetical protein
MAEPLKNLLNETVARQLGARLQAAWPPFDRRRFERLSLDGLAALELKARRRRARGRHRRRPRRLGAVAGRRVRRAPRPGHARA